MRDSPHHIEKRSANHVATDAERLALQLRRILDQNNCLAESAFQKRPDLVAA